MGYEQHEYANQRYPQQVEELLQELQQHPAGDDFMLLVKNTDLRDHPVLVDWIQRFDRLSTEEKQMLVEAYEGAFQ